MSGNGSVSGDGCWDGGLGGGGNFAIPPPSDDPRGADLGDVIIMLLAGTLAGLRDRLKRDGFTVAAELLADLTEIVDDYLIRVPPME